MTEIHSCSYYCDRPECIKAQRDELRDRLAQPEQGPVNKYCCHSCFNKSGQVFLDRMILCPECGNKRCPKASHHDLPCTTSNEPGQPGGVYTAPPQRKPWVGLTDDEKAELDSEYGDDVLAHLDAVEAKLKEKNT